MFSPIHLVLLLCYVLRAIGTEDSEDSVYFLKNRQRFVPKPSEYPPFQGCYDGAYMPDSKKRIRSYKVNLDLPPDERWKKLILDKKMEIVSLVSAIKNESDLIFGVKLSHLLDLYMPLLTRTLPKSYHDELVAVAQLTNLPLGEITLFNLFYEFFSVCTSIVMEGSDGQMYHGRNMDFGLFMGWDSQNKTWLTTEHLRPLVVNVDFLKNNQTLFTTTTFAGYLGVLTALKKNAFSLTINERFQLNGGYVGLAEWVLGRHNQQWMGLLTRGVMEQATSYAQAREMLIRPTLIAPVYFILAGPESAQGTIITRGRSDANVLNIGSNRTRDFESWYLVQTNYDHWVTPPFFDDRRGPSVACLNKWGRGQPRRTLFNVLSTRPVLNKLTVYTTIMNVQQGTYDTQLQDCKTPCWPW